eukprot:scaffold199595_cov20-Tisochrysis_lutea.AAC.3
MKEMYVLNDVQASTGRTGSAYGNEGCGRLAKTGRTGSVDAEEEVAHGLMTYFDKALPVMLLYRNERDQAADVSGEGGGRGGGLL